ncbi:MAG: DUF4982 domain-containing protein [Clostridia bacterium]|nr:DUF4982 domain-containing protein [Clostridia bacterium]
MKKTKLRRNWTLSAGGENRTVEIPHDFLIGQKRCAESPGGADAGYFPAGRAEYRTEFAASEGAAHHFLSFDGVMGLTEVLVNGQPAAFHPYGYTAFLCDIQPYLQEHNILTVRTDTTQQIASRWYTGGGIYRDVTLLTADEDYIVPDSVFVKTKSLRDDRASVCIEWQIASSKAQTAKAVLAIPELDISLDRYLRLEPGVNDFSVTTMLSGITAWSPETPHLYTCTVRVITDSSVDSDTSVFGIRTVECDPVNGLLLNGKPIKLYGTCVHHDNGIIGAASYASAEERRVRILREYGFNAIRCAHNPPSSVMLDACDRLGMLVIDEIFDAWRLGKRDYDYHRWFDQWWEKDTDSMVRRDRHHPSVILWSTGNEIYDKTGKADGWLTSRKIADRIRKNDDTRPLTHAFCSFWDDPVHEKKEQETNSAPADTFDYFTERIRYTAGTLDVYGYNYLLWRMDKDQKRFPDMLFALTESFPLDAVEVRNYMHENPRMIGEFVWTGWDYFGETGLGCYRYREDTSTIWGLTAFPEHHADCGDFDICGFRKAQSYYREAAWNPGCVRILSQDPAHFGKTYAMSAWGFHPTERTWTYPGCEGCMTLVHLYTTAQSCELWLNGVSYGRKTPSDKGIAEFAVPYQPGVLTAAAYAGDDIISTDTLTASTDAVSVRVRTCDRNDLVYAEIEFIDDNGNIAWSFDAEVTVSAENGRILGTGSGENAVEHVYTSPVCKAYHGKLLAAILPDEGNAPLSIRVSSCGMETCLTLD